MTDTADAPVERPRLDDPERAVGAAAARRPAVPLAAARPARRRLGAASCSCVSGFTDWADGVLARKLNQTSALGRAARPARRPALHPGHPGRPGAAPRHPALAGRRHRRPRPRPGAVAAAAAPRTATAPPAVHYLGKAATFCLLYAFPLLLLGTYHGTVADIARPIAWALHHLGHRALPVGRRGLPGPGRAALLARRRVSRARRDRRPAHGAGLGRAARRPGHRHPRPRYAAAAAARRGAPTAPAAAGTTGRVVAIGCLLIGFVARRRLRAHPPRRAGGGAGARPTGRAGCARPSSGADGLARAGAGADDASWPPRATARCRSAALARSSTRDAARRPGRSPSTGPGCRSRCANRRAPDVDARAPGAAARAPIDATHILTDRDVRSVVNELWADGAEAISVNGVRLDADLRDPVRRRGRAGRLPADHLAVPRSARSATPTHLSTSLRAELRSPSRYQTLASADGIGFDFDDATRIELPASAPVDPRYASP